MNRASRLRPCGKRYATEAAAMTSKRFLAGGYSAIPCQPCGGWHLEKGQGFTHAVRQHERRERQRATESFPRAVCQRIDRRDSVDGIRLCVRDGSPQNLHRHHRRIKGTGGDPRPHTDCACNGVTLCADCHAWAHANRREAEAEGLIIPSSVTEPWLYPVLVHSAADSGSMAFPACSGEYVFEVAA